MGDDNSHQKQRKSSLKYKTSYSNMAAADAEKRLGIRIRSLKGEAIATVLADAKVKLSGWTPSRQQKQPY